MKHIILKIAQLQIFWWYQYHACVRIHQSTWDPQEAQLVTSKIPYDCVHNTDKFKPTSGSKQSEVYPHTRSILHSCNVHWIKENVSLPQSSHVCQLLPACGTIKHQSNHVFSQANIQLEKTESLLYGPDWTDSPPNTIFKLHCNLVHSSYPPNQ